MKRVPLYAVHLAGVAFFLMPFWIGEPGTSPVSSARAGDAPWLMMILMPLVLLTAISQSSSGKLDAQTIALLGVLCACTAVLRVPLSIAGANLFFLIPLLAGFVFGPTFGFLVGALGMASSAVITVGFGPWLPFQMWAAGWIAGGAGVVGRWAPTRKTHGRPHASAWVLAVYGWGAAFIYGALMNLYFWPVMGGGSSALSWSPGISLKTTLIHFRNFYLATSMAWDAVGAISNAILLVTLGPSLLRLLWRYRKRMSPSEQYARAQKQKGPFSGASARDSADAVVGGVGDVDISIRVPSHAPGQT